MTGGSGKRPGFPPTPPPTSPLSGIPDEAIKYVKNGLVDGQSYGLYWPRHLYGRVVKELESQGARAIAFDILFEEQREDHKSITNGGLRVGSDQFARQILAGGNVLLAAQNGALPEKLFRNNALAIGDIDAEKDGDGILRRAKAFQDYRIWHPAFQQTADDETLGVNLDKALIVSNQVVLERPRGTPPILVPLDKNGNFDLEDFIGTNIPIGMARFAKPFQLKRVWHMGIVLAAQELKLDLDHARIDLADGRITLAGTDGLVRVIPVDKDGYFYIDWCISPESSRLTSAPIEALLAQYQVHALHTTNQAALELASMWDDRKVNFRGKLVVIGSKASGNDLTDRGATPLSKETLLVSKHWNVANSVLTGRFIRRSSRGMELLLIVLMVVLAGYLTWSWQARAWISSAWMAIAAVGYTIVAVFLFVEFRYWIPVVLPIGGGLLGTHFALLAYLVFFEQAERRRVRSVFRRWFPRTS